MYNQIFINRISQLPICRVGLGKIIRFQISYSRSTAQMSDEDILNGNAAIDIVMAPVSSGINARGSFVGSPLAETTEEVLDGWLLHCGTAT